MLYEFKEQDAYDFSRHVGIKSFSKGRELHFELCPYCKGGESKDAKTFSINLKTGMYKCLRATCGAQGNMITLAQDFDFSLGRYADMYYKPKNRYREFKKKEKPIIPKTEAVAYLEKRGISRDMAEKYEITVQTKNQNVLVFPFYDENGILQYIKYRDCEYFKGKTRINKQGKKEKANKEWSEDNCKPILFGMKQCEDFSRLVICEGQMDSLSVATCGIKNAVSVPTGAKGLTWIPYCWDWINKFEEVVVFGDYEKGQITLLDELRRRLKTKVNHVREEDYKDCKDANEILLKYGKEKVIKCVENSVVCPVKHIIRMADVKGQNKYEIPKVSTGIKEFDKILRGGLPFGSLVLVTGKSGKGKSTLANQMIINALEQGYKCFVYSGELPTDTLRDYMDYQVAGPSHVFEYSNRFCQTAFAVSETNKNLISEWYGDNLWIYDDFDIDEEESEDMGIVRLMKESMMMYDTRVFLLDNLMTAIDLEDIGEKGNEKQAEFVSRITKFARRYGIVVILVAHKRKNNFSQEANDEVMGSSAITNLASVIISYDIGKDLEENQRTGSITKNRLFGTTGECILTWDNRSTRIYGHGDDLYKEYGWTKNEIGDGFRIAEINEETPFDD